MFKIGFANINNTKFLVVGYYALWYFYYIPPTPSHHLRGGGHTDFGADPIGISIGMGFTLFFSAQYLVNQWLNSYQISWT